MCKRRVRGRHCVREKDYDGRTVHRLFSDASDAREYRYFIRRRRERAAAGLEPIPERITFAEWADRWVTARKRVRPEATWRPEVARLKRTWRRPLGAKLLSEITTAEIDVILAKLVKTGSSPATRNRHRAMIHRIFSEAKKQHRTGPRIGVHDGALHAD